MSNKNISQSITEAWAKSVATGMVQSQKKEQKRQQLDETSAALHNKAVQHILENDKGFYRPDTDPFFRKVDGDILSRQRLNENIQLAMQIQRRNPGMSQEQALTLARQGVDPARIAVDRRNPRESSGGRRQYNYGLMPTSGLYGPPASGTSVLPVSNSSYSVISRNTGALEPIVVDQGAYDFLNPRNGSGRDTPILSPDEEDELRRVGGQAGVDAGGRAGYQSRREPPSVTTRDTMGHKSEAELRAQNAAGLARMEKEIRGQFDAEEKAEKEARDGRLDALRKQQKEKDNAGKEERIEAARQRNATRRAERDAKKAKERAEANFKRLGTDPSQRELPGSGSTSVGADEMDLPKDDSTPKRTPTDTPKGDTGMTMIPDSEVGPRLDQGKYNPELGLDQNQVKDPMIPRNPDGSVKEEPPPGGSGPIIRQLYPDSIDPLRLDPNIASATKADDPRENFKKLMADRRAKAEKSRKSARASVGLA